MDAILPQQVFKIDYVSILCLIQCIEQKPLPFQNILFLIQKRSLEISIFEISYLQNIFFLKFYLKNIIKLYFVKVKLLSIIWTYDRYIGLLKKFNRKKYLGRDIWTTERFQLFSRRNYWKSSTLKNT